MRSHRFSAPLVHQRADCDIRSPSRPEWVPETMQLWSTTRRLIVVYAHRELWRVMASGVVAPHGTVPFPQLSHESVMSRKEVYLQFFLLPFCASVKLIPSIWDARYSILPLDKQERQARDQVVARQRLTNRSRFEERARKLTVPGILDGLVEQGSTDRRCCMWDSQRKRRGVHMCLAWNRAPIVLKRTFWWVSRREWNDMLFLHEIDRLSVMSDRLLWEFRHLLCDTAEIRQLGSVGKLQEFQENRTIPPGQAQRT
ncbi:hypothetical protein F5I97DRAFT_1983177 [Phlebopus sp. FC_14]|nr:hypothetical protein F5I97DRAFT_1983177 [Phlebopus sp. FC_14]